MMKRNLFVTILISLLCLSCSCYYDDSEIKENYKDLIKRVTLLENLCNRFNEDISSLKDLVSAIEEHDYIQSVSPEYEGDEVIGYSIVLSSGKKLLIRHGKDGVDGIDGIDGADGADGSDYKIGVRQDTDGVWYWMLNGTWMLDEDGNRVAASGRNGKDGADGKDGVDGTDGENGVDGKDGRDGADGKDGKDGITPQFRIIEGYWEVSYDNGTTWVTLGKAVGEDGADGSDGKDGTDGKNGADGKDGVDGKDGSDAMSVFAGVDYSDDEYVIIYLTDGTVMELPRYKPLTLTMDDVTGMGVCQNTVRDIPYSISGASEEVQIETIAEGLHAEVIPEDVYNGIIRVTVGGSIEGNAKVLVFVVDKGTTVMKKLTFEDCVISLEENTAASISYNGGDLPVNIMTNTEIEIIIPDEASSWVSLPSATKSLQSITRTVVVAPNNSDSRSVTLTIKDRYSDYHVDYTILQQANPENYVSTDFSRNGTWKTMQDASTEGTGLNIVFMGDAYTDVQIADGTYDRDMKRAMDHFFEVEPYASLKDMFNCYQMYAVSKNASYKSGSSTVFECRFGAGTLITGYNEKILLYAQKVDKIQNGNYSSWYTYVDGELYTHYRDIPGGLLVVVVLNSTQYAGTCYSYLDGQAIAFCPLMEDDRSFAQVIHHEAGGHGFARLADEYDGRYQVLTDDIAEELNYFQNYGFYRNVDTTGDSQMINWAHLLAEGNYSSQVGIYEGGYYCSKGVWRSSYNSIMRHNTGGYNAPSREIIYRRAMELSKGDDYDYSLQDFVEFDARNLDAEMLLGCSSCMDERDIEFIPFAKPVILMNQ